MMSPTFRSTSTPFRLFVSIARDALEEHARAFSIADANARQILTGQWLVLDLRRSAAVQSQLPQPDRM